MNLKVMSFNIRYSLADDGKNRWEQRKALVAARIQEFGPDLLGIQECSDNAQAVFVKSSLPDYEFYGVRRQGEGESAIEMAPALIRKSEFRVVRKGYFWISETPQIPGSKSWDSLFPRTVTWAELNHRPSSRPLVFINTHFDFNEAAIEASARFLLQWIEQNIPGLPVIVTGDFNADKESPAYRRLTETGLLFDAYRAAGDDLEHEATFHKFGNPAALSPIDWVLASRHFKAISAKVDRYHEGGLYPSDHYPVTAVLDWKN